ncbi:MAG: DUF4129 domain-containing protein [Propionicimonas sp.]
MERRAWLVRGGVIAAVVLVVLGAASATPWVITLTIPQLAPYQPPETSISPLTLPPQAPSQTDPELADTVEEALLVLLAVVVTAVVGYAVFRLVRRLRAAWRPEDALAGDQLKPSDLIGEQVVDITSLATAVARAEAHLAGRTEPGDAVTAAWVALEDEAALQGSSRAPSQTATEFTAQLLRHTPAPPDAVATLRGLYHKARFTAHPVTVEDVNRARLALARIAKALDAALPVTSGDPS